MLVKWLYHISHVIYWSLMQQHHTSHVTCAPVLSNTSLPIPMPHHHVSVKPQGWPCYSCNCTMLVKWLHHISHVIYWSLMQQHHTSHVTCAPVLSNTSLPIPMPHHHVSVKPQGCINAEFWVGPAEECGEPPTLPRIHEEKYSIVAHHQPLQRPHVRSNLLYGLGYTRKSEEVWSNWPLGNQIQRSLNIACFNS